MGTLEDRPHWRHRWRSGPAIVGALALAKLVLHLATAGLYGLFVDELYFLACGEHLAWGYVDMPPLTALQAWLARTLFGDSMLAIRLLPALAGAGLVLLAGALARELGGGRLAQILAALGVLVAPIHLFASTYLSMNSIEPLVWTGCALVLLRLGRTGNPRLWPSFGLLAGVGLQNKHTMLVFGFALLLGLLLVPERRLIFNRYFLLAGGIAFAVFLPNLVWMIRHDFPMLELLANIRRNQRNVELNPFQFMGQQALFIMHPLALPLWAGGLAAFLFLKRCRRARFLGIAYLATLAILLFTDGRVYYLAPAYPMLLAGGAAALERWLARPRWRWAAWAYPALLAVGGLVTAPLAMPLLSPENYLRFTRWLGFTQPQIEHRRTSALPQLFADRFGWPEMAAATARVFHALPPAERARAAVYGNDYGEAGAIDFYGPRLGLPKAISAHQNYWYWGPRHYTGAVGIVLGEDNPDALRRQFESVTPAERVGHPYAMRSQHFTIYVCRGLRRPLAELWPEIKDWS